MSVCLENNSSVLPSKVGKLPEGPQQQTQPSQKNATLQSSSSTEQESTKNNISKLIVTNSHENSSPLLQKVVNPSVITVVNTPITVVKTIGGATTSHFTLVNSTTKSTPTITLVNAPPITVVKSISEQQAKNETLQQVTTTNNGSLPVAAISEKSSGIHNVFVKKSAPAEGGSVPLPDMPQSHKILTANTFPTSNVIPNLNTGPILKTANGQRNKGNKLKILSNVVMPTAPNSGPGPSNVLLNKNQRYYQQKVVSNGATKYLNKSSDKKVFYPINKTQLKTVSGYKSPPSTSQVKSFSPGAVHRTGSGLKTIPPQRQPVPNKPNYIGKHAVQAQKVKPKVKTKPVPIVSPNTNHNRSTTQHPPEQSAQVIFNQALTAQILETLSDKESTTTPSTLSGSGSNKMYNVNTYMNKYEPKQEVQPKPEPREYKPQGLSTLDTLSFVCQAVLLDHNYNATLPVEPTPPPIPPVQPIVNGTQQFSPVSNYSSGISAIKRNRTTSQSRLQQRDDDAASDISEERKLDTEGEETDTAPEAEAVTNEGTDRYGDYVTRCICGFIHDDGYMIECDRCKVWQHVRCVVKTKKVPDDYLCEECDPSKHMDRQKARALQQQWMREIQERDTKIRKEQLAMSDSDSSDNETPKNRRKEPPRRPRRDSMHNRSARPVKKKERKVSNKRTKGKQVHGKSDDEKIPQLRQWIENYEEAVTNHYSPELRARISSIRVNGAHSELSGNVDPTVNKCKVQTIPPGVKCLTASVSLPMGTPVVELRGKYMLSTQHRATTRQQRPGPFLFFHTLIKDTEVCVDTRTYGNCARFIRRSCTPNAELQHVLEKGAVHLYVVTTKSVDKGAELTIRHESHDLAAAHLTEIPCACTNPEFCGLIKGHRRHNGDNVIEGRKRRGRHSRDNNITSPTPQPAEPEPEEIKKEQIEEEVDEKKDVKVKVNVETKIEQKIEHEEVKIEPVKVKEEEIKAEIVETKKEEIKEEVEECTELINIQEEIKNEEIKEEEEEEEIKDELPPPVTTRRTSRHTQDANQSQETSPSDVDRSNNKKLSREERKLQAIMKAIERMEKQEQRRQEHQAKQAHRRESEPTVNISHKEDSTKFCKRRKRKGRARTTSTNSRRNRLDSTDSIHSSDDTLLSPPSETSSPTKAAGLLLALANGDVSRKSPERTMDSNSNSAHSSPETPLSSACLLVAAAVEPLEPGFKFPKTKKVLMNEWLNKSDVVQSASAISPSSLTPHIDNSLYPPSPAKNLNALCQAASLCDQTPRSGSAKKRWLRQAISEDQCDSPPQGNNETVAPPKKRRLPRESLSAEGSPASTPTNLMPASIDISSGQEEDMPSTLDSETSLNDISEANKDYASQMSATEISNSPTLVPAPSLPREQTKIIMDPRLAPRFSSSELVGTVEKSLSFLGLEETKKPEAITPAKRKLSITEYRQRKKLNNNEKCINDEISIAEESNSSQSPKLSRTRSNSTSSISSGTTSDDELPQPPPVPEVKALSAFNSEPTELERQRENVSIRLKKALGLSVDEGKKSTPLNVETILKCDLPLPVPAKSSICLSGPNFPIPGSMESVEVTTVLPTRAETPIDKEYETSVEEEKVEEPVEQMEEEYVEEMQAETLEDADDKTDSVLYYTPDDEEMTETTSYVPPFNNPLYPNTSYTTYGSVIDDDVPYEGRNPSPPPNMENGP